MNDLIVTQLLDCFKAVYGLKLDSPQSLSHAQQNLMEFVMGLGRKLENKMFAAEGTGYRGAIVERKAIGIGLWAIAPLHSMGYLGRFGIDAPTIRGWARRQRVGYRWMSS